MLRDDEVIDAIAAATPPAVAPPAPRPSPPARYTGGWFVVDGDPYQDQDASGHNTWLVDCHPCRDRHGSGEDATRSYTAAVVAADGVAADLVDGQVIFASVAVDGDLITILTVSSAPYVELVPMTTASASETVGGVTSVQATLKCGDPPDWWGVTTGVTYQVFLYNPLDAASTTPPSVAGGKDIWAFELGEGSYVALAGKGGSGTIPDGVYDGDMFYWSSGDAAWDLLGAAGHSSFLTFDVTLLPGNPLVWIMGTTEGDLAYFTGERWNTVLAPVAPAVLTFYPGGAAGLKLVWLAFANEGEFAYFDGTAVSLFNTPIAGAILNFDPSAAAPDKLHWWTAPVTPGQIIYSDGTKWTVSDAPVNDGDRLVWKVVAGLGAWSIEDAAPQDGKSYVPSWNNGVLTWLEMKNWACPTG